jgi:hypothetical protein
MSGDTSCSNCGILVRQGCDDVTRSAALELALDCVGRAADAFLPGSYLLFDVAQLIA